MMKWNSLRNEPIWKLWQSFQHIGFLRKMYGVSLLPWCQTNERWQLCEWIFRTTDKQMNKNAHKKWKNFCATVNVNWFSTKKKWAQNRDNVMLLLHESVEIKILCTHFYPINFTRCLSYTKHSFDNVVFHFNLTVRCSVVATRTTTAE